MSGEWIIKCYAGQKAVAVSLETKMLNNHDVQTIIHLVYFFFTTNMEFASAVVVENDTFSSLRL